MSRDKRDLQRLGIDVGDIVAIDPGPEFLDNGYIVSRHLDNKAGTAAMMAAAESDDRGRRRSRQSISTGCSPIAEEVGVGASAALTHDVAAIVSVDNGTTAPGQNSDEFGVTIAMADQTGPFDFHSHAENSPNCARTTISGYQKDVFPLLSFGFSLGRGRGP